MAVVMMVDNPEGSQDVYDKVRAHLGIDKPAGGTFHVAGPSPTGGFRVIELWEAEEDARRFLREPLRAGTAGDRRIRPAATDPVLARAQHHDAVTGGERRRNVMEG